MTVSDPKVVDIISIDAKADECILIIADHLPWGDGEHLLLLQSKINTYLAFLESGEILEEYPAAKGKRLRIRVECLYEPDETANEFLVSVRKIIRGAGFEFDWHQARE